MPTASTSRTRKSSGTRSSRSRSTSTSKSSARSTAKKTTTRRSAPAPAPKADPESRFKDEALDNVGTAVMFVDRDLIIYYLNKAAVTLMRTAEPKFREVWPDFSADNLLGQCIDKFHRDPSHQRRILDDPSRLPYKADIEVAGLSFGLSVTAQIDDDGEYVGCCLEWEDLTELLDAQAKLNSVDRATATIEFNLDGTILGANANFFRTTGYTQAQLVGQHHRMLVEPAYAASPEYRDMWERLRRGEVIEGEFKRVSSTGETIWLQATYNPVLDRAGTPIRVFKLATDITAQKRTQAQIESLVDEASAVMEAMARGDLTRSIRGDYEGKLDLLREATNASVENLTGLVTQIRKSASSMSTSAKEVAQANLDLSRRTEAQASSLEQTASSMEEMTATVQQNADNARKASQLAAGAREQATNGGEVVENAVSAMREISESSKKIADIIGVIDEIAFQTNLLALNAAVEAARAGDQGRGFAVVASEVRNLAQRSAGAAKEIKALIQDSLEKVEDGSELVNRSGSQLDEIVTSVKKVSDIIAEIAAASEEQSAGISQVNQAVSEMDQGTQQNAAMVEQAAAASESVQLQSNSLQGLTQRFRVHASEEAPAQMPEPALAGNGRWDPAPAGNGHWDGAAGQDQAPFVERRAEPAPVAQVAAPAPGPAADDDVWQEF